MSLPSVSVAPGPATHAFAITPGSSPLPSVTRYLWVGTAGDITVQLAGDTTAVTFSAVPAGTMLPICATKVTAFSGTAGSLIGLA